MEPRKGFCPQWPNAHPTLPTQSYLQTLLYHLSALYKNFKLSTRPRQQNSYTQDPIYRVPTWDTYTQ